MKYLYSQIETKNKYFLNLENFKNQEIFVSIENFEKFIKAVYDGNGKFYLFLDEFHKVKNIDQFLKIIYDDYPFVKIIAS
jgi:predicted AAA+ superfamily ATPase